MSSFHNGNSDDHNTLDDNDNGLDNDNIIVAAVY
jgi:hypothetical protein